MENCLFWNLAGGAGDAMNSFIECVALSKKNIYSKIILCISMDTCYGLYHNYFKKFIIPENLIILSSYHNHNELYNLEYLKYFENLGLQPNDNGKLININNNFYYSKPFVEITEIENNNDINRLKILNINLNDLYKIELNFSSEDNKINNEFYNKVIEKVGRNYICIFHDYARYNSVFSFRATRILNADFISFYISLMSFFLYISCYSVYFYSNLYYKHK